MPLPRRAMRWLALGMAATLGLTACSGSDDEGSTDASATVSQAEIDKAMQAPTELTFWTWVPDISPLLLRSTVRSTVRSLAQSGQSLRALQVAQNIFSHPAQRRFAHQLDDIVGAADARRERMSVIGCTPGDQQRADQDDTFPRWAR